MSAPSWPSATALFIGPPADSASQVELNVSADRRRAGTRSISVSPHTTKRDRHLNAIAHNLAIRPRGEPITRPGAPGRRASEPTARPSSDGWNGTPTDVPADLEQPVVRVEPLEPVDAAVEQRAVAGDPAGHRHQAERSRTRGRRRSGTAPVATGPGAASASSRLIEAQATSRTVRSRHRAASSAQSRSVRPSGSAKDLVTSIVASAACASRGRHRPVPHRLGRQVVECSRAPAGGGPATMASNAAPVRDGAQPGRAPPRRTADGRRGRTACPRAGSIAPGAERGRPPALRRDQERLDRLAGRLSATNRSSTARPAWSAL